MRIVASIPVICGVLRHGLGARIRTQCGGQPVRALFSTASTGRERRFARTKNAARMAAATLWVLAASLAAPAQTPTWTHYSYTFGIDDLQHVAAAGDVLWFGTLGGVVEWDTLADTAQIYTRASHALPDNAILDIAVDTQGDVWVATWSGLGRRRSAAPPNDPWTRYDLTNSPLSNALAVAAEPAGGVWVGTYDDGLYLFDGTAWTHFDSTNSGLINPHVTSILVDLNGDLWIGTGGGVFHFDGSKWTRFVPGNTGTPPNLCSAISSPPPHELGLISGYNRMLGCNPFTGVLWIECLDDHPTCLNEGTTRFDGESWSTYSVWNSAIHFRAEDVAVDSAGLTWIVSLNGIQSFDRGAFTNYGPPRAPATARSAAAVRDDMWFGSGNGLTRLRGGVFDSFVPGGLADNFVRAIAFRPSPNGTEVWIGNDFGLQRFDGRNWRHWFIDNSPLLGYVVRDVEVDLDQSLWIASGRAFPQSNSDRGGVQHMVDRTWITYTMANSGLVSNQVSDIAIDPLTGEKWFAYVHPQAGLSSFDGSAWTFYAPSCPFLCQGRSCIPGHPVADIEIDAQGVKWIATRCGLTRFDGLTWTTFDQSDGLASSVVRSSATGDSGILWVATDNGVSRFDGVAATSFLVGHDISTVAVDALGRVWAAERGVGVHVYDGQSWITYGVANGLIDDRINVIGPHPMGDVWIGTEGGISAASFDPPIQRLGELNCDGAFNGGDIDPFFLALGDPAAYAEQFPKCDILLGDMNGDGLVNGGDIDPFFACLGGGVCP